MRIAGWSALLLLAASLTGPARSAEPSPTAPRDLVGHWGVVASEAAPWAPETKPALPGGTLIFRHGELAGLGPLRCEPARYEALSVPPEGLFGGSLPAAGAAATAARLGLADPTPTLRVTCPNASFDFHLTSDGKRLRIALDSMIYTFERR